MSNFSKKVSGKVSNFSKKVSNLAAEQKEKLLKKTMGLSSSIFSRNEIENENKIWNPKNNYRPPYNFPNQLWESNNNDVNNKVKKVPNNSKTNNTEVSKINNTEVSKNKVNKINNTKVSKTEVSKNSKDIPITANKYINEKINRKNFISKTPKIKKQILNINKNGKITISFTNNSEKLKKLKKSIFDSFLGIKANSILTENQKNLINKIINKKYNELPVGNSNNF